MSTATVDIIGFDPALSARFRDLNLAWLKKYFTVEPVDEVMLSDPEQHIIRAGGHIFFARVDGQVAGTFALIPRGPGVFELGKMAVEEAFQGRGIGQQLLAACIREAQALGAQKVILYSNTRLAPAIHLYRKHGFVEVPLGETNYKRSDIKMEKILTPQADNIPTATAEQKGRLAALFSRKQERILNVYCTAGYPQLDSTLEVMMALQESGADLIELGMPYSDPLADGPVIQASSARALSNGMTIGRLFAQLQAMRPAIHLPVILMGYLNPVLQYGFERFCKEAAALGVDGLIIPDLPIYEFETEYGPVIKKHGLDFIFLVTPETSEDRIRQLDTLSSGFLYAVSSSSITGSDKDFSPVESYLRRLKDMNLKNPLLVGFGIRDRATFETACRYASGAIIGTAYIQALGEGGNIKERSKAFLGSILE